MNHRGSRLLAADLVKNFLFQIVESQRADVAALYHAHWRDLDSDYWRQQVAQGRFYRPRIDVFLNHWLTMTLRHEVPADRVFVDFRDHVRRTKPPISELLTTLASDAAVYARLDRLPYDSVEGRFHYRVLRAMNSGVVGPLLLWLLRWDERLMPVEQRAKAITALESWIVRRSLCRATVKDLNRLVVDLLKALDTAGPEIAGDTVENYLAAQTTDSRFWPTDAMLHDALAHARLYSSLTRPRLRMVLEALEDSMRGPLGEGQPCPRNLSVEHVMPQAWREHWSADIDGDEVAALRRDQMVHTLGNLTLVSGKLNPTLSNRPWTDAWQRELPAAPQPVDAQLRDRRRQSLVLDRAGHHRPHDRAHRSDDDHLAPAVATGGDGAADRAGARGAGRSRRDLGWERIGPRWQVPRAARLAPAAGPGPAPHELRRRRGRARPAPPGVGEDAPRTLVRL
ncbi:MAG: HNH endonuclease family protein [Pseudonocardiaceae bacterium]